MCKYVTLYLYCYFVLIKFANVKCPISNQQNSAIGQRFADHELQGLLLGDAGYRLESWIMTPVRVPRNNADRAYNRSVNILNMSV